FSGSTPQVVQARHRSEPPRPLTYVRPNLPPELQVLLDATLAKLPADRPAAAATVVQQLDALLAGAPGLLSGALPAGRSFRPPYLIPVALGIAGLGVLLAIGAVTRARATGEPAPVIVAEFEGPAAEVELTRAFRELLIAGLGESARLALIPPHQIREAMRDAGMADSVTLTPDRAREIAFRLSVRAVVNGAVRQPAPGRYALMVSSVDAESGRMLTSETESASESTFVPAVQRITSRLRRSLGDRRADIEANKPLWQVATPSFEAFRKYVQAVDLGRAANLDGSNRLLREAIAIDTGFASAWGVMGMNFIAARNLDSARIAFAEALRRPGRLNDAQRYRMEAEAAYALHHDLTAAVHWYGLYLQEVPLSVGGRNNRGLYLSAMGRLEDALADFVRAVELERGGDGVAQPQLLNAAIMLWALGRSEEARRYRARLSGPFADYAALVDAAVEGSWTLAESLASRITADPAAPSWVRMQATGTLASALAMRGDIAAARRLIDTAAAAGGTEGRWYLRAARLMEDVSGKAGPLPGPLRADTSVPGTLLRAEWLAAGGDTAGALAALDAALDRREVEGGWFGFGVEAVRARILGARGDWGQAARLLSPLAVVGEPDNTAPDRIGTLHLRWLAADAWERAGRKDSADAYHARLGETTRLAANQLALRGLVLAYSSRRLARLH
ncbi:MAG TPA: protein kinase family protein, partial [Gemmatimonadales bacterium]|nr:protein kinase family protein [Gemmatimonadales bacterium]